YLVLARGSDWTNSLTFWSVQAIEKYTGISRGRAAAAIEALRQSRLIRSVGEKTRPSYEIATWYEINCTRPLTAAELAVYQKVLRGDSLSGPEKAAAARIVKKGLLRRDSDGSFRDVPETESIWLPNTLVSGAADETP